MKGYCMHPVQEGDLLDLALEHIIKIVEERKQDAKNTQNLQKETENLDKQKL
jgi:hypothetical protein